MAISLRGLGGVINMRGIDDLNAALKVFAEKNVPEAYVKGVRYIALQWLIGCVAKTGPPGGPNVITGTLRGGWQLSIGKPAATAIRKDKAGQSIYVRKGEKALTGLRPGQSVWISNPVEYAPYQNYGTEKIEGHFMLERTTVELLGAFE